MWPVVCTQIAGEMSECLTINDVQGSKMENLAGTSAQDVPGPAMYDSVPVGHFVSHSQRAEIRWDKRSSAVVLA